jgi:ketosteroid isomerase-like protein
VADELLDEDALRLWATVQSIYTAFLAGDRDTIDASIAEDATLWDAFHEPLLRGKSELAALRSSHPDEGPRPTELRAEDPVIDVYGDIALVRHVLIAVIPGQQELRIRNTGLWRRDGERWLCVHNHEGLLPSV